MRVAPPGLKDVAAVRRAILGPGQRRAPGAGRRTASPRPAPRRGGGAPRPGHAGPRYFAHASPEGRPCASEPWTPGYKCTPSARTSRGTLSVEEVMKSWMERPPPPREHLSRDSPRWAGHWLARGPRASGWNGSRPSAGRRTHADVGRLRLARNPRSGSRPAFWRLPGPRFPQAPPAARRSPRGPAGRAPGARQPGEERRGRAAAALDPALDRVAQARAERSAGTASCPGRRSRSFSSRSASAACARPATSPTAGPRA